MHGTPLLIMIQIRKYHIKYLKMRRNCVFLGASLVRTAFFFLSKEAMDPKTRYGSQVDLFFGVM